MSQTDVICHWQAVTGDGGGGGTDDIVEISGAIRLFNIWLTAGAVSLGSRTVICRNGSASADILLKFQWCPTRWSNPYNNTEIPGGGILFDSGFYLDPGNDSSAQVGSVTLLYQRG